MKILRYNPNPTGEQIRDIMKDVGCGIRTVYNARSRVLKINAQAARKLKLQQQKKNKRKKRKKQPLITVAPTPPAFAPKPKRVIPPIAKNMSFEHFCKYYSFPHYDGLYRWQYEWFREVWKWKYSLTLVARDHGKSIGHSNIVQWVMSSQGFDVIYLGWTSRRKQIADFVYNFFLQRDELIIDKTSSNYHFKTKYGTTFDTYSVKSKEILGMHEVGAMERQIIAENRYLEDFIRSSEKPLLMIIDDAIDNTFRKERHKEEALEEFFSSTIININPDKLMTVGTNKFEGDFYYFIQEFFGDDIYVYKRTPFLAKDDPRYDKEEDNPSNLLCPERWICETHPDYPLYLELLERKKLGIDVKFTKYELNLIKKKDLTKRKNQIGEYWWSAEYMQDPHPITGEIWEQVHYEMNFKGTAFYDLLCISIDRATTTNRKSDYTGITVFFRDKEDPHYLVTNDFTQKIRITDLVVLIDKIYKDFLQEFRRVIRIVIVVEKQGGGDDFIALAEDAGYRWAHLIIPVHNTRDKMDRIVDNLGTPIKNAEITFIQSLQSSELVKEILTAPYSSKIDALDALSNGYFECEKLPSIKRNSDVNAMRLRNYREETKYQNKWQEIIERHNTTKRSIF